MGWVHFPCGVPCTDETRWIFGYLGNYEVTFRAFHVVVPKGLQRGMYATSRHPQRWVVDVRSQKVDAKGDGETSLNLNGCQEWELVHPGSRIHNVLHLRVSEEPDSRVKEQYVKASEDAELASKGGVEDYVIHLQRGIERGFKIEVMFAVAVNQGSVTAEHNVCVKLVSAVTRAPWVTAMTRLLCPKIGHQEHLSLHSHTTQALEDLRVIEAVGLQARVPPDRVGRRHEVQERVNGCPCKVESVDAVFWKHYDLCTLSGGGRHLLLVDVEVPMHELQGLLAAGEGQRVGTQEGSVLVHGGHVAGSLAGLGRTALLGRAAWDGHSQAAATQEKGQLPAGSGHGAAGQSLTRSAEASASS